MVTRLRMPTWNSVATGLIFLSLMTRSCSQDDPSGDWEGGFISIDCGSNKSQSIDSRTNLTWVNDEGLVLTGKNGAVPHEVSSSLDNYEALGSFRYFPKPRSKFCYELQMKNNNVSFLIRTMFLHGKAPELTLPITFKVSINGTFWITMQYGKRDNLTKPQVREGIFFIPYGGMYAKNRTNVCLIPEEGVPFISSLELRQLDPEGIMYSRPSDCLTRQQVYLTNVHRWNTGVARGAPTVRYPDDDYDRFWIFPDTGQYPINKTNVSLPENVSINSTVNNVPYKVMKDAWTAHRSSGVEKFNFNLKYTRSGNLLYCIFYFILEDGNVSESGQLSTGVAVGETGYLYFNVTTHPSMETFFSVLNDDTIKVKFDYSYLTINALEFYEQGNFVSATTNSVSVKIIDFLKEAFHMNDWNGDPCNPVEDDWIKCGISHFEGVSYLQSINVSYVQLPDVTSLLKMKENKNFMTYDELSALSITHSNIDNDTFHFFLQTFTHLMHLNLGSNNISLFPSATEWAKNEFYLLQTLNLSHNRLTEVPHLINYPFYGGLQELDLSNNYLNGSIRKSLHLFNLPCLKLLNISNNSFTGDFPINSSFQDLQCEQSVPNRIRTIDAQHNKIMGVLDLTIWYNKLKAVTQNTTNSTHIDLDLQVLISLVNNDISDIIPNAEAFQPIIDHLISIKMSNFNHSGILLGGNPYCRKAKLVAKKYLCRSSVDQTVYEKHNKNNTGLILGITFGGSSLLFCIIILSVIIWRLWKKNSILQKIQQELANRRVQPPYYSYRDLKLATNNFHQSNNLGEGAFGAVYKGVLRDGSTIAVKKLFNSQQKQVLNDFLNEVVLITGIKHKNLIQLKGCCIEHGERILVYEYAENGNVTEVLRGKDIQERLSWENRSGICIGVARGLSYLHEELQPRIIHRDIKPANVLLDKNLNAKVSDFGLAKSFQEEDNQAEFTQFAGTRGYLAPEYAMEGRLTTKADVFSFGILVLEITSGRKCLDQSLPPDETYLKYWAEKLQNAGQLLDLLEPTLRTKCHEGEVIKVINIALLCIRDDSNLRPTMSQVVTMLVGNKEDPCDYNVGSLETAIPYFDNVEGTSNLVSVGESNIHGNSSTFEVTETSPILEGSSIWSKYSSDPRKDYFGTIRSFKRYLSERVRTSYRF